jgi:hypothetical protein
MLVGITRLRAAGSSSHALQPFFTDGPFLSNALVQHHVAECQNLDVNLLTPARADFQAVGSLGRRSKYFDIMGMAALVCRHEFVMTAVNLFTEENFAYYDLMLADVLKQYSQENGRHLQCFFLDIACQFKPYWNRCALMLTLVSLSGKACVYGGGTHGCYLCYQTCMNVMHASVSSASCKMQDMHAASHEAVFRFHPGQDMDMAIGPWHARVHKPVCQRVFGARRMPNTGLTFGDNIEHLWASLRKFSHLSKYMSDAARQDFLCTLVRTLIPCG